MAMAGVCCPCGRVFAPYVSQPDTGLNLWCVPVGSKQLAKQIRAVFRALRRFLRGVGRPAEVVDHLGNTEHQQRRDEGRYKHRQSNQHASSSVSTGKAGNDCTKGQSSNYRRKEAEHAQDEGENWLSVGAVAHGREDAAAGLGLTSSNVGPVERRWLRQWKRTPQIS